MKPDRPTSLRYGTLSSSTDGEEQAKKNDHHEKQRRWQLTENSFPTSHPLVICHRWAGLDERCPNDQERDAKRDSNQHPH